LSLVLKISILIVDTRLFIDDIPFIEVILVIEDVQGGVGVDVGVGVGGGGVGGIDGEGVGEEERDCSLEEGMEECSPEEEEEMERSLEGK
jgi:hypothetical protein